MKQNSKLLITTRTLAYCALLAALSIVLARLMGLMPDAASRFSIEAVPIFLAGMFFGPLAGGMVGFVADFVGCLFSPFGYNPVFCIPPILYGVFAGLFRRYLNKGVNPLRLFVSFLPPVVLGSLLYQSAMLSWFYFKGSRGSFLQGYWFYLSTRGVQFAIVIILDVLIIYLLFRTNLFRRVGLWPLPEKNKKSKGKTQDDCTTGN